MDNVENFEDTSQGDYYDDPDTLDTKTLGNFSFLEVNQKVIPFKYRVSTFQTSPLNFHFLENRDQYTLIIPIIIENDSLSSSKKLRKSMNSLYLSLPELHQIGITNKNILICLFFLNFSSNKTFSQLYPNTDYLAACCTGDLDYNCSSCYIVSSTGIPIPIISFNKNNATSVECLKVFYLIILDDIKNIQKTLHFNDINSNKEKKNNIEYFYVLNWENGVIPQKNTILNLIKASSTEPMSLIPAVNTIPNNYFGETLKFYYIYLQIYFYYYYDMTTSCPLDHKFHLIKMDKKFFDIIKKYFSNYIYNDADMLYHDYKFAVYLDENGYNTYYINEISVSYYERNLFFNDFMMQYCKINSASILIIFDLLRSFTTCKNLNMMKITKKFFLFFQIIDIFMEFFYVGFTILISYSIFHESFSQEDDRLVSFFTIVYIICTVCSCSFSLITPKQSGRDKTFLLFHILFYMFYIMFFVCTFMAVFQIKKNKDHNAYQFNYIPLVVLVSLDVILYLIPLLLQVSKFYKNIVSAIKFFSVSLPGMLSVFRLHYLINFIDLYGQSIYNSSNHKRRVDERKKMVILLFFLSNASIGFIAYFLTNRTRRVNFIFSYGMLFTIFLGLKIIAIIIGCVKLYLRKRHLIKFMEDEKKNQNNDSNSLSASLDNDNLDNNNDKNKEVKVNDMNIEQLRNYFGNLETKTEFSNLESRRNLSSPRRMNPNFNIDSGNNLITSNGTNNTNYNNTPNNINANTNNNNNNNNVIINVIDGNSENININNYSMELNNNNNNNNQQNNNDIHENNEEEENEENDYSNNESNSNNNKNNSL